MPERRPRRRKKLQIVSEDSEPSSPFIPGEGPVEPEGYRIVVNQPDRISDSTDWDELVSVPTENGRPLIRDLMADLAGRNRRYGTTDDYSRMLESVQDAIHRQRSPVIRAPYPRAMVTNTLTIGADPEFILLDRRGQPVSCSSLCTETEFGEIGDDHSHRVGEFRPRPGSPRDLVQNMKHMIAWVRDHKPNTKMVAGGGARHDLATGGHIHFNIKNYRFNPHNDGGRDGGDRPEDDDPYLYADTPQDRDQSLLNALDSFIGRKLNSMEGADRAQRVNNSGNRYGLPGDWRWQPHGFEYRTPASFIGDPVFAEAVYSVAHQVAAKWLADNSVFSDIGAKAKKSDYRKLYPTEAEMPSSSDRDYYMAQVQNFVRLAWDSDFRLDNDDLIERWTRDLPTKAEWRDIPLVFNSGEDTGIALRGHVTVPMAFRPDITEIRVRGLAEWRNMPQESIVISRRIFDGFNVARFRNQLRNNGVSYIGTESENWDIMIPHLVRMNGSHGSQRMIETFFRALGQDPCIDR